MKRVVGNRKIFGADNFQNLPYFFLVVGTKFLIAERLLADCTFNAHNADEELILYLIAHIPTKLTVGLEKDHFVEV